jgi:hypothetical protein
MSVEISLQSTLVSGDHSGAPPSLASCAIHIKATLRQTVPEQQLTTPLYRQCHDDRSGRKEIAPGAEIKTKNTGQEKAGRRNLSVMGMRWLAVCVPHGWSRSRSGRRRAAAGGGTWG